jgi:hypothetical protein
MKNLELILQIKELIDVKKKQRGMYEKTYVKNQFDFSTDFFGSFICG